MKIDKETIDFLEYTQRKFRLRYEQYRIGKGASRDRHIKDKYRIISHDLKKILEKIKDGQD